MTMFSIVPGSKSEQGQGEGAEAVDPEVAEGAARGDHLELELRHLPGVNYVAMTRHASLLLIELGTDGTAPAGEVAASASRAAEGWLDCEVEIQIIDEVPAGGDLPAPSSLRVQLLAAIDGEARPGADQRIEIHLVHRGRHSVAHAAQGDLLEVAEAALAGLRQLGFPVPFVAEAVHVLPEELGAGVLVSVHDRLSGDRRRGIATGRSLGETIARAVLNSLNRYLQTIDRHPDEG